MNNNGGWKHGGDIVKALNGTNFRYSSTLNIRKHTKSIKSNNIFTQNSDQDYLVYNINQSLT